jgi:hypothetical protein
MSEKTWKILRIFGIGCLILIFLFIIGNFFTSRGRFVSIHNVEGPFLGTPTSERRIKEESKSNLPETSSRMIIKNGWLNLVVKDVTETAKKIIRFTQKQGGWVVFSNISEIQKIPSGQITVRVPAEKFEETLDYFKSLAQRVSNEKTQAQDITEEYVDLQSRLKNLEAAESQLLEIMKRSGTISGVLEVHRELRKIREEIERIKGKMQYLKESAKMSSVTVNLALSEELLPIPPSEKWRPKYVLLQTWKEVLDFWKKFSYLLIKIFVWAQVWIPLGIICVLIRRYFKRKKVKGE